MPARAARPLLIAAGIMIALALPFLVSDYRTFQLTQVILYAIALCGLNLLMGFNGQVSLGHGAFYALGAYTAAILIDSFGFSPYLTVPVAGIVTFVAGYLFGIPALRLHGLYLALATLALALALPQLLRFDAFEPWTGGVQGIFIDKPDVPFGLPLTPDQWLYVYCLAIASVMFWLAANLVKGRIGRALIAIRDNPIASDAMGIDTARYKSLTFGISALYTGIAGALSAVVVNFVAPDSFDLFLSITLLVGVVVGGLASISGAIYGGAFIVYLPNIAEKISDAAPWAIYGLFLIALMFVMPDGVAGLLKRLTRRLRGPAPTPGRPLTALDILKTSPADRGD
ncbi:MAG: branched-chain amino acid ABC transporter permease [Alphaproteobacteria bacterium]